MHFTGHLWDLFQSPMIEAMVHISELSPECHAPAFGSLVPHSPVRCQHQWDFKQDVNYFPKLYFIVERERKNRVFVSTDSA